MRRLHGSVSNKGSKNEKKVGWKRKPFAAGTGVKARPVSMGYYRIFLTLIAIHTSIFIIPWDPAAGSILLLALLKGWMNGI
jgi:hypothetical protein